MKPVKPQQYVTALGTNYDDQLQRLADVSDGISGAPKLCVQRPWMMPAPGGWSEDLFDLAEIGLAFDRDQNNGEYVNSIDSEPRGVLSDTIVSKAQVDYLAMMERSFRMRHTGAVRAEFHAAGRRRGHGHINGLFQRVLPQYLEKLIAAGANPADERTES